jgi:hypothetical protein
MQVGHIVYGDDIEFFFVTLEHRAQTETADPTEPIDRYIGHLSSCRFVAELLRVECGDQSKVYSAGSNLRHPALLPMNNRFRALPLSNI